MACSDGACACARRYERIDDRCDERNVVDCSSDVGNGGDDDCNDDYDDCNDDYDDYYDDRQCACEAWLVYLS